MKIINLTNTEPNENGIYKKITKYTDTIYTKQKIEIIQKTIIQNKIHNDVIKRKKTWKPFGKALNTNNSLCTFIGDEITMEMMNKKNNLFFNSLNNNNTFNICSDMGVYNKFHTNKNKHIKTTKKYIPSFTKSTQIKKKTNTNKNIYVFKPSNDNNQINKNKLFLKNFNKEFMEDDIAEFIEHIGDIKDIYILRNKKTGDSKGMAFITVYKNKVAQAIIDTFHKKPMGNTIVHVEYAKNKK